MSPGMYIERICRLPFDVILDRTQNPLEMRQHSAGLSPSRTMA